MTAGAGWRTPVQRLGVLEGSRLWAKRDDLFPFCFGGNKARKALLFFEEVDSGGHDCVVTYGSGSSNHCRVVANMCRQRGIGCHVVSPAEASAPTSNSRMVESFGAEVETVPVEEVHDAIESTLARLKGEGRNPYFIAGGGHGDVGTEAYVRCYREIRAQENELGVRFDRIYLASGTGTTQAGLVCGQVLAGDAWREVVGVSVARKNPYGRDVVLESARSYLGGDFDEDLLRRLTVFVDDYTEGYGSRDPRVDEAISFALDAYGLPLDPTYTGKAFLGMRESLATGAARGRDVLFLHTGGTPLFFDWLAKRR